MKVNSRSLLATVTGLCAIGSLIVILFYQHPSQPEAETRDPRYFLSATDIKRLEGKSQLGDCDASIELARYYLDGALKLDTATKWLRNAAKFCADPRIKEYLVEVLMHDADTPANIVEIEQLIEDIRKTDAAKAKKLEDRLNGATKNSPAAKPNNE